jgi:hypothetical protein
MARNQHSGSFLIVEGETSDFKVYRNLTPPEACRIIAAHGKDNVIGVLKILEEEELTGILAIVDADFWRLEGKSPASSNLKMTDTHDLETMIIKSPALEKLLVEFGSNQKIKELVKKRGKSIREILLSIACPIGYLRWISLQQNLSLQFEGLNFRRFVDEKTFVLDRIKLIRTVKNKSDRHDIPDKDLQKGIDEVTAPTHDPWEVCCGHDLACILSLGLRKALGSKKSTQVEPERIEESLRLAYEFANFSATDLYQSLKAWEAANEPFQIFPTS